MILLGRDWRSVQSGPPRAIVGSTYFRRARHPDSRPDQSGAPLFPLGFGLSLKDRTKLKPLHERAGATGPQQQCRECGQPFASELQMGDLKQVLPELGFDYSLADGGNWQDVCPACRRR